MPASEKLFERIANCVDQSGVEGTLEFLVDHFRKSDDHVSLFEALKMEARHRLGLPLMFSRTPDQMDNRQQRMLEDALLDACREVGTRLFKAGQLREGWMYLQPVGDANLNRTLIQAVEVNDENADDVIEISVSGGAAPAHGFQLILERFGTCNAITTMDTQAGAFDHATQAKMAELLTNHLYRELVENIQGHIKQQEPENASELSGSLSRLLQERDWLTSGGGHHIDTTHLASVVRIGKSVSATDVLAKLVELCEYGKKLSADFHYKSEPPFEDTYRDHGLFYQAIATPDQPSKVKAAIEHFTNKSNNTDRDLYGLVAVETLVDLMHRVGQTGEAIALSLEKLVSQPDTRGIAPNVFEIASNDSEYELLTQHYRKQNEVLGYAVSLLKGGQMGRE